MGLDIKFDFKGFLEDLPKAAEKLAEQTRQKQEAEARQRLQMEKQKANQVFRNGGACFNCAYCNATSFCNNTSSSIYDKRTNEAEKRYGVLACPYWKRNY